MLAILNVAAVAAGAYPCQCVRCTAPGILGGRSVQARAGRPRRVLCAASPATTSAPARSTRKPRSACPCCPENSGQKMPFALPDAPRGCPSPLLDHAFCCTPLKERASPLPEVGLRAVSLVQNRECSCSAGDGSAEATKGLGLCAAGGGAHIQGRYLGRQQRLLACASLGRLEGDRKSLEIEPERVCFAFGVCICSSMMMLSAGSPLTGSQRHHLAMVGCGNEGGFDWGVACLCRCNAWGSSATRWKQPGLTTGRR